MKRVAFSVTAYFYELCCNYGVLKGVVSMMYISLGYDFTSPRIICFKRLSAITYSIRRHSYL